MFIFFLLIFVVLLLFPFLLAFLVKFDDKRETSLIVRNDNVKDPRYFSKSFKNLLKNGMKNNESQDYINLSRAEKWIKWNPKEEYSAKLDKMIYIRDDTVIPEGMTFKKEIYSEGNLRVLGENKLRAAAGEKDVVLEEGTIVQRWVDAERNLVAREKAHLGVSATAGECLIVEPNCKFERLYAPVIRIKNYEEKDIIINDEVIVNKMAPLYKKIVRDIDTVEPESKLRKTVITDKRLVVGAGATVFGDIRSEKYVHIKKGAMITGNVFAEYAIIIEEGAKVFGSVFATGNVYIGPDAVIGIIGRTKSVVSISNMIIAEGAVIYGYVGTEKLGRTVKASEFAAEVNRFEEIKIEETDAKPAEEIENIVCKTEDNGYVCVEDIDEYEAIDYYGFRNNEKLKGIIITNGAKSIMPSMFFGCKNLEYVRIPNSVTDIGEYAFYQCEKLKNIEFENGTELSSIGEYAFSECGSLVEINLPKVNKICNAAFRNDSNLEKITVIPNIEGIECHKLAFHNCEKLNIDEIGIAFFEGNVSGQEM